MNEYDPKSATHRAALAAALVAALDDAGFIQDPDARGEITYRRAVTSKQGPLPSTVVKVYTTIPLDRKAVRGHGKDAIRVCAVHEGGDKPRGLVKEARVFRTGTVERIVERTVERARDAWSHALSRPRCRQCDAPTFVSKQGNNVCAAICWKGLNESPAGASNQAEATR